LAELKGVDGRDKPGHDGILVPAMLIQARQQKRPRKIRGLDLVSAVRN
jgi:hypothetical protein